MEIVSAKIGVQQNFELEHSYRNQMQSYHLQKINAENNLIKVQKKIAGVLREIEDLEKKKSNIQNIQGIQVSQPPVTTELAKNKTNIKRNVIMSSVVGLFAMLFLGFFLEYVHKYKKREP